MAKTALITGATGLLGRQVLKAFQRAGWNAVGTGFTRAQPSSTLKVDLGSQNEIITVLDEVKNPKTTGSSSLYDPPPLHLHSLFVEPGAANRFPDKCDADPSGARAINVTASGYLAHATNTRAILLIYISTDYVFPGNGGEAPYQTDAQAKPPNLYGQTKLDGEKAVLAETRATGLGVVLRVPVLYGEAQDHKESAVNVLLDVVWKAQEKNADISVEDWASRYPTNTEDVGRVCQDIATKYIEAGEKRSLMPKVLHFSSEDRYTKYEICQLLADIMGLPLDGMVRNKQGNDPNGSVQRPYDTHLSTNALKDLGIDVQTQNFKDWWWVMQHRKPKFQTDGYSGDERCEQCGDRIQILSVQLTSLYVQS
ncbi:MAG: hypothetical protein M1830_010467 [Pleopsidium flavum]|nr:MAG: hypothetical protein M1830_010467 [Pleopsidium flavum]